MALAGSPHAFPDATRFRRIFSAMLGPEAPYYRVVLIYSVAISLLTLAIPISVQMLIDSVANTGLFGAVLSIGVLLFVLLLVSGVLYAVRAWTMELFARRLFTRLAGEITMTGLLARSGWFENGMRQALFNRFFDIMTVKKNIPYILTNGFTLLFQSVIGFVVVSLYHFYFFVFSIALILLLWLVWKSWGWKATHAAFELSAAKHDTAAWLQCFAINNGFFKTRNASNFALARADTLISQHVEAQARHFGYSYRQLLCFLFLYALASAVLLTIGGWLVIMGELTLGQLVAAELIMSAIFFALPQLSGYLDYYYDVCAAVEELSLLDTVDTGSARKAGGHEVAIGTLRFSKLSLPAAGSGKVLVDCSVPPGTALRLRTADGAVQDAFCNLLKGDVTSVHGGAWFLGEVDLSRCSEATLRSAVEVIDRQTLLPVSIREYLSLADERATPARVHHFLELAGLQAVISRLPENLDTLLTWSGAPLLLDQALRLKLVHALLGDSQVLVLTQLFDCLPAAQLEPLIRAYTEGGQRSVLYFTQREDLASLRQTMTLETGSPDGSDAA